MKILRPSLSAGRASPHFRRIAGALAVLFVVSVSLLAIVPIAHSANPIITVVQTQKGTCGGGVATCAKTFAANPTAGNTLVATCGWAGTVARTFSSFTSTADTWVPGSEIDASSANPVYGAIVVAYVKSTAGGANAATVTCTISAASSAQIAITMYELSVTAGYTISQFTFSSGLQSSITTGSPNVYFSGSTGSTATGALFFALGGVEANCDAASAQALVPGSGFTQYSNGGEGGFYQTGSAGLVTNFPFSWSSTGGTNCFYAEESLMVGTSSASQTITQSLGGSVGGGTLCGTGKITTTTQPTNATVYYYEGVSVGSSTVTGISSFVASIIGSASQTLTLGLYIGSGPTVSGTNPLVLQASQAFSLTSGTKNSPVNWAPSGFSIPSNVAYAIALLGTDHIKVNQSGVAGMFSVSSASLPTQITGLSSSGAQLSLCAVISFQSFFIQTVTQTVTTGAGSTVNPFGSNFANFVFALGSSFGFDTGTWGLVVTLIGVLGVAVFLLGISAKLPGAFNPLVLIIAEFLVVAICTGLTFFPFVYFLVVLFFAIGAGALKLGHVF